MAEENLLIPHFFKNWKSVVYRGIVSIIFGIVVIIFPFDAANVLAIFFGAYLLIDGLIAIISIITSKEARGHFWSLLTEGILGIAAGIITFFIPATTILALILLISIWALITGIFEIITAFKLRRIIKDEYLMVISGLLSIIFGVLIILRPFAGILVVIYLIAAYSIFFGILMIFLGIRMRKLHMEIK